MERNELLLEVENLSKSFRIRKEGGGEESFLALNNIGFSIYTSQVIGLIGENGSGKSTLLRILSRMLKPDTGKVTFYGRSASVLEIGSGFHQDLSGAENVKLVGSLLGVPSAGSRKLLEEVTDFSELGRFMHEPVKHYSSGMFLRLAFSVAMLSDADILFLDEVIGVGDESFSRKTVRRIRELSRSGKSILMATHSSGLLTQLCSHAILLHQGKIKTMGEASEVIQNYTAGVLEKETRLLKDTSAEQQNGNQKWVNVCEGQQYRKDSFSVLRGELITAEEELTMDSEFELRFEVLYQNTEPLTFSVQFNYQLNISAMCFSPGYNTLNQDCKPEQEGVFVYTMKIPSGLLNNGLYSIHLIAVNDKNELMMQLEHFLVFEVKLGKKAAEKADYKGHFNGPVFMELPWTCIKKGDA